MKQNKFKKYFAFTKAGILDGFQYKFSAFGWLLGDLVSLLVVFFLWQAIYKNSPSLEINGMTFEEMVAYLIYARIASSLVLSTASFWIIGEDIYEGNIAVNIVKPINYRYRLLASSFGNFLSSIILMFIPLWIASIFIMKFAIGVPLPSLLNTLLFLISVLLSFVIADSLNFLIGQITIFTNAMFGLMLIKNTILSFLSGGILPSNFFPLWLTKILQFLPFQSMIERPIMMLLGKLGPWEMLMSILIQIAWVIVLNFICNISFNCLQKRIVSAGG